MNEFEIFPSGNELKNYSLKPEQKSIFERFYSNIFVIKNEFDVEKIDQLCAELKIQHLIIMPTMTSVKDRKIALKKVANYYKLGDKHEKNS